MRGINQKRVVIWENRALKSLVGMPVPSGFEARSNALNFASSKFSACRNVCVIKRCFKEQRYGAAQSEMKRDYFQWSPECRLLQHQPSRLCVFLSVEVHHPFLQVALLHHLLYLASHQPCTIVKVMRSNSQEEANNYEFMTSLTKICLSYDSCTS